MFKNLNNIFNTSKIDKKNYKTKNIQSHIENLKNTQINERSRIDKINKISDHLNNQNIGIDLDHSLLSDDKNKEQNLINDERESHKTIHFDLEVNKVNKVNEFFSNLEDLKKPLPEQSSNIFFSNNLDIKKIVTTIEKFNELEKNNNGLNNNDLKIVDDRILNNIDTIHNVYKESYTNKFVTGFGDFLRGCYFLLEFCAKYKLKHNFIILHPIKHFLKNKTKIIPNQVANNIEFCEYINQTHDINSSYNPDTSILYYEIFEYLNKQTIINKNIFIYNVCYPTTKIENENIKIIRNMIEPIDEIKMRTENILKLLKLTKYHYKTIHIRSGDQYLNKSNETLDDSYKNLLLTCINNIMLGEDQYLLIADNVIVKNLLVQEFPHIKTHFKEITHLGENSKLNYENIKNTMIDFYIMSYSSMIYSVSCYDHGSGFSKWCAFTYNIPYFCAKI